MKRRNIIKKPYVISWDDQTPKTYNSVEFSWEELRDIINAQFGKTSGVVVKESGVIFRLDIPQSPSVMAIFLALQRMSATP